MKAFHPRSDPFLVRMAERRGAVVHGLRPALEAAASDVLGRIPGQSRSFAARIVDTWAESTQHPGAPERLSMGWARFLSSTDPGVEPATLADVIDSFAQVVASASDTQHQRWLLEQLEHSAMLAVARREFDALTQSAAYMAAGATRDLAQHGRVVRQVLSDALSAWSDAGRGRFGSDLTGLTIGLLFDRVVQRLDLDAREWRALWLELDGLAAERLSSWPHMLSPALRLMADASGRYEVLLRIRETLSEVPDLWHSVLDRTLRTPSLNGFARRFHTCGFPVSVVTDRDPGDVLVWVRDALAETCADMERHQTDPVEDTAVWIAGQLEAHRRSDRMLREGAGELEAIAQSLVVGLTADDATSIQLAIPHLLDAVCRAVAFDNPGERLARTVLMVADGCPTLRSRAPQISHRLQSMLLDADEPEAAGLANRIRSAVEQARSTTLTWGQAHSIRVAEPRPGLRPEDLGALARSLGDTAGWMDPPRAAMVSLDRFVWRLAGVKEVSVVAAGIDEWCASANASGPIADVLRRVREYAPRVLAAIELGSASRKVASVAADLAPEDGSADRAEHSQRLDAYRRLLRESGWQLIDLGPDPAQALWDDWSPTLDTPLDAGSARRVLATVRRSTSKALSQETASLAASLIGSMFASNLGVDLEQSDERPSVEPRPYIAEGLHWSSCFGVARVALPELSIAMGPFREELLQTSDPEIAALRAAAVDARPAEGGPDDPALQAWELLHSDFLDAARGDREVSWVLAARRLQVAEAIADGLSNMHPGEHERQCCIRDQGIFLAFLAERISAVPASLAALEAGRYLTMAVGPFVSYSPSDWYLVWTAAQTALDPHLSSSARACWVRWCDQLAAMASGIATMRSVRELLHGEEPVFSEVPSEERRWRELVATLLACAVTGSDAPFPPNALVQRLVLSDALLGQESAASWSERSAALGPFLQDLLAEPWGSAFIATLEAVGAALANVELARSDPPAGVTTAAQVLSSVPGTESRWRADHLVRHHARRGLRDPADLTVVRATGWRLPGTEENTSTLSELESAAAFQGPVEIRVERKGILDVFRSSTRELPQEVRSAAGRWVFRAVVEDRFGSGPLARRRSLTELCRACGDVPVRSVVEATQQAFGGSIEHRGTEIALASLAVALEDAPDAAETLVGDRPMSSEAQARCVRDVGMLLKRVWLYAAGESRVHPADWYRLAVLPFLMAPTPREMFAVLSSASQRLDVALGPHASTLADLLRPHIAELPANNVETS